MPWSHLPAAPVPNPKPITNTAIVMLTFHVLPDLTVQIYRPLFIKEGVAHSVEQMVSTAPSLVTPPEPMVKSDKSTPSPSDVAATAEGTKRSACPAVLTYFFVSVSVSAAIATFAN